MFSKKITDPKAFGKVAVLMGGLSREREVSLMTGNNILAGLKRNGIDAYAVDVDEHILMTLYNNKPDRVFIALHGIGGEDGTLQGALDHLHIPYPGCGMAASALAMDKQRAKLLWQGAELPTARFRIMKKIEDAEKIVSELGLPLFFKPINEGSSLGAGKVESLQALKDMFLSVQQHYNAALVEQYIDGPEYTVSILHGKALPSILIRTPHEFYDYQAKYFVDTTEYICPAGLSDDDEKHIKKLAEDAYLAIGCRGWGRVDIMRDKNNRFYLLEINTIPGMTDHSLMPQAARAAGVNFDDLVWLILENSFEPRHETPF